MFFYPKTYLTTFFINLIRNKIFNAIRCSSNIFLKWMCDVPLIRDAIYSISSQCWTFRIFTVFHHCK